MSDIPQFATLLVFLALSFVAIVGWGTACCQFTGLSVVRSAAMDNFWVGYLFTLFMVELLNLWVPIDWRTSAGYLMAGGALFFRFHIPLMPELLDKLRGFCAHSYGEMIVSITAGIYLMLVCAWSMAAPINEDSWGYHFQSIRWMNEYPIVPGLGNLHGRFAFNQSHFGFLALFNIYPYWNKGYAAGGLLLLLAAFFTVASLRSRELPAGSALIMLLLIVLEPLARYSASPSPDFVVSLLQVVAIVYLLSLIHAPVGSPQREFDLLVIFCVGAAMCSVKLSGLVFATLVCCVGLWCYCATSSWCGTVLRRVILLLLAFAVVHVMRGVMSSGVPLYPSTLGSLWRFDWSIPTDHIRNEAGWIYSCARTGSPCKNPSGLSHDWSWVSFWWDERVPAHAKNLFFASVASVFAFQWFRRSGSVPRRFSAPGGWLPILPFAGALLFWFLSAPDVRFLGQMMELMFAVSFWSLVCVLPFSKVYTGRSHSHKWDAYFNRLNFSAFPALLAAMLLIFCVRLLPAPYLSWPALEQPIGGLIQSERGVTAYVPANGSCWFQKLPCTPYVHPQLEYREPSSPDPLIHGFRLHTDP